MLVFSIWCFRMLLPVVEREWLNRTSTGVFAKCR